MRWLQATEKDFHSCSCTASHDYTWAGQREGDCSGKSVFLSEFSYGGLVVSPGPTREARGAKAFQNLEMRLQRGFPVEATEFYLKRNILTFHDRLQKLQAQFFWSGGLFIFRIFEVVAF